MADYISVMIKGGWSCEKLLSDILTTVLLFLISWGYFVQAFSRMVLCLWWKQTKPTSCRMFLFITRIMQVLIHISNIRKAIKTNIVFSSTLYVQGDIGVTKFVTRDFLSPNLTRFKSQRKLQTCDTGMWFNKLQPLWSYPCFSPFIW